MLTPSHFQAKMHPVIHLKPSAFFFLHFSLLGHVGLQPAALFMVLYFPAFFIATDRQLKSAEHTLAARQQAVAP